MLLSFSSVWYGYKRDPVILRAAARKHQLDLEIAKKSNFFKLAENEALRALVTKILF